MVELNDKDTESYTTEKARC